jgi:hypothetical protein
LVPLARKNHSKIDSPEDFHHGNVTQRFHFSARIVSNNTVYLRSPTEIKALKLITEPDEATIRYRDQTSRQFRPKTNACSAMQAFFFVGIRSPAGFLCRIRAISRKHIR